MSKLNKFFKNKKNLWLAGGGLLTVVIAGTLLVSQGSLFQGYLTNLKPAATTTPQTAINTQKVAPVTATKETKCTLSPGPYYVDKTITATLTLVTQYGKSYSVDFDDGTANPQTYPTQTGLIDDQDVMTFTQDVTYIGNNTNSPRFSGYVMTPMPAGIDSNGNPIIQEKPIAFTALCGTINVESQPTLPLKITSCAPKTTPVTSGGAAGTDVDWIIKFTGGDETKPYSVNLSSSKGTTVNTVALPKPDQDFTRTIHYDESATGDKPQVEVTNGTLYDGWYQCQPLTIEASEPQPTLPGTYTPKIPGGAIAIQPIPDITVSCHVSDTEVEPGENISWKAETNDLGTTDGKVVFTWYGTATSSEPIVREETSGTGVFTNKYAKTFASEGSDLVMGVSAEYFDANDVAVKSGSTICKPNIDVVAPPAPSPAPITDMQVYCEPDRSQAYPNETINWSARTEDMGTKLGHVDFTWNGTALSNDPVKKSDDTATNNVFESSISKSYPDLKSDLKMGVIAEYYDSTSTKTRVGKANCSPNVSVIEEPSQSTAYLSNPTISVSPWNPDSESATFSVNLNNAGSTNRLSAYVKKGSAIFKTWLVTNTSNGINKFPWDGSEGSSRIAAGTYTFEVVGTNGTDTIDPVSLTFNVIETNDNSSGSTSGSTGSTDRTVIIAADNLCAGFTDVTEDDPDCNAFTFAKQLGALTGNDNGTLRPGDYLQRDQIAKIIAESIYNFDRTTNYAQSRNPFPDVTNKDWSYQYVALAKGNDVVTGYKSGADAGFYRPARNVNRVEFLTMLLRAIDDQNLDNMPSGSQSAYSDTETNTWYSPYTKYSKNNSLFTGSYLYPGNSVTRREVAKILYKLHQQDVL